MIKKMLLCLILLTLFTSALWANGKQAVKKEKSVVHSLEEMLELKENQAILHLEPLDGRAPDTLIYDDGSTTSGYSWGVGYKMAMRMSPTSPCQILGGIFYGWSVAGTPTFNAEIFDWSGSAPTGQLGSSVAVPTSTSSAWRYADFSSQSINVTGDFIMSFSMLDDQTVIGFDPIDCGRAWDYTGSWGSYNETYFIRAVVEYGGGTPDIECVPNPLYIDVTAFHTAPEFSYRSYAEKISKELKEKLEHATPNESFRVIVEFDKIIDSDFLLEQVQDMSKSERRAFVINTLQDFASSYQKDVMDYLEEMNYSGKVEKLSQLWITNSIGMKATKEVIEEVAEHSSVALIWLDKLNKPFTSQGSGVTENNSNPDSREIVWNVLAVDADDVWGLGYTGTGIIVGHIDTGVNYNHNDLADHMWDGSPAYPNHGYDFVNNDNDPMDTHGHGTHTAGTVAGDGTAGSQTGVAPDAQIMALLAVPGYMSDLEDAVGFALTNGADVLSMSAGWDSASAGGSWNSLSNSSRTLGNNCTAAGVVWAASAGNGDGYGGHYAAPYDIGIPANVPAPWYGAAGHSGVMAVGATNQGNTIASFSSLGATQWGFGPWNEYTYPPGLIKPDVCAPGGNPGIKSLDYANINGYAGPGGWVGTSMACPHLAGIIALMLQKNPSLTPAVIDSIVEATCLDLGTAGRDNTFGAGLVNALAAVNAVSGGGGPSGTFYVKNEGDANLNVDSIAYQASWITSVSPQDPTVSPSDSQAVTVQTDVSGLPDGTYYDTLQVYSNDPDENPYGEVIILTITTGIEEEPVVKIVPVTYSIKCYPNPARNIASIRFTLPCMENITVNVYNVSGRKVTTITNGEFESGVHNISWNRKTEKGVRVPQGIYFIRLNSEGTKANTKLIVID